MTKYILSVDGGGIRGIVPALILAEIEKKAKKPISQIFDLMAGTSTGSMVVAGLSKKDKQGNLQYAPNDLVELYKQHGSYIFKSSFWRKTVFSWFTGAQYSYKYIELILDKYFGESTFADVSNNIMITSYDIHNNCPFFFKSWKKDLKFIKLKDALRATTAAPTYFKPKRLNIHGKERLLVDGGILANNPAACAYAGALKLFPNYDIVLLSIGTGRINRSLHFEKSRKFGRVGWIKPLLHIIFTASLDAVNYQLNKIMGDKYIRLQSQLTLASPYLDDVTQKNVEFLQEEAYATIGENRKLIDKFCSIVS